MALEFLKSKGLKLLEQNYRGPGGEIDLIMLDGKTIAFIEVRYRANSNYADALESIDSRKCSRIIKTGQLYLQNHPQAGETTFRFDVTTITGATGKPGIEWIKNAFQA